MFSVHQNKHFLSFEQSLHLKQQQQINSLFSDSSTQTQFNQLAGQNHHASTITSFLLSYHTNHNHKQQQQQQITSLTNNLTNSGNFVKKSNATPSRQHRWITDDLIFSCSTGKPRRTNKSESSNEQSGSKSVNKSNKYAIDSIDYNNNLASNSSSSLMRSILSNKKSMTERKLMSKSASSLAALANTTSGDNNINNNKASCDKSQSTYAAKQPSKLNKNRVSLGPTNYYLNITNCLSNKPIDNQHNITTNLTSSQNINNLSCNKLIERIELAAVSLRKKETLHNKTVDSIDNSNTATTAASTSRMRKYSSLSLFNNIKSHFHKQP